MTAVATGHYPFVPRFVLRDTFRSIVRIPTVASPIFAVHGLADDVIPPERGKAMIAAAQPGARFESLPGVGHNDVVGSATSRRKPYFVLFPPYSPTTPTTELRKQRHAIEQPSRLHTEKRYYGKTEFQIVEKPRRLTALKAPVFGGRCGKTGLHATWASQSFVRICFSTENQGTAMHVAARTKFAIKERKFSNCPTHNASEIENKRKTGGAIRQFRPKGYGAPIAPIS
jgi:hypothetical protein